MILSIELLNLTHEINLASWGFDEIKFWISNKGKQTKTSWWKNTSWIKLETTHVGHEVVDKGKRIWEDQTGATSIRQSTINIFRHWRSSQETSQLWLGEFSSGVYSGSIVYSIYFMRIKLEKASKYWKIPKMTNTSHIRLRILLYLHILEPLCSVNSFWFHLQAL